MLEEKTEQTIRKLPGPAAPAQVDLEDPSLYFNRELSWLDFNERVLELAEDSSVPLLERLRFCSIYSSNLDEYFMVRVAGITDQFEAGIDARGPDGLSPSEQLDAIADRVAELDRRQQRCFEGTLRPALAEQGIRIVSLDSASAAEREEIQTRFNDQVFPALTPLVIGLGRPFPYISNLSLSLAVLLRDPETETEVIARVKVPKELLRRFLSIGDGPTFVPLEEVIAGNLDALFPGTEVIDFGYFKVTRDADFTVSDEADDLLLAVQDELRRRRFGEVLRLELSAGMNPKLRAQLTEALRIEEREVYESDGLLDLADLGDLVDATSGHAELRYPAWSPVTQPRLQGDDGEGVDMFGVIRQGDLLVHHPYDSFPNSVVRFIEQAVADPDVLAIKMTVYRTSDDSPLVPALIRASERGKQAVCMVELKARFDEEANIGWAKSMEEAGVHVVYGIPGLKTHTKAVLVARREGDSVRQYVHVGTGNYNQTTARLYTDLGLFTADPDIGADVAEMFNFITGYGRPTEYRKVLVSPTTMRKRIREEIEATIEAKRRGEQARIAMKMNALGRREQDPGALRGLPGRSAGRPQRARDLLPAPRDRRHLGERSRQLGGRALPRALARLRLPARREDDGADRLRRPDAPQPRPPGRARRPDRGRGAAGRGASTSSSARWPTTPTPGASTPTVIGAAASPARGSRATSRPSCASGTRGGRPSMPSAQASSFRDVSAV